MSASRASDAPIKTFKQALTQEFLIGASQPGTSTRDYPAMLNNTTGAKIKQVSGYPGTREITLAIEKNEVHGLCGFSWSSLKAQKPDWIKSGFIRVIVQEHDKGNPEINKMGVPLAVDFATSPENRKIMELIYSSETFGRPYLMAPDVPADRVAALRKAFMETMKDQELLAEAAADRARHRSDLGRGPAGACRRTSSRRRCRSSRRPRTRWSTGRRERACDPPLSKVGGAQFVGALVAALVDLCRGRADLLAMGIERLQQALLVGRMPGCSRRNASAMTKNDVSIALSYPQNRTACRVES